MLRILTVVMMMSGFSTGTSAPIDIVAEIKILPPRTTATFSAEPNQLLVTGPDHSYRSGEILKRLAKICRDHGAAFTREFAGRGWSAAGYVEGEPVVPGLYSCAAGETPIFDVSARQTGYQATLIYPFQGRDSARRAEWVEQAAPPPDRSAELVAANLRFRTQVTPGDNACILTLRPREVLVVEVKGLLVLVQPKDQATKWVKRDDLYRCN